MGVGCTVLHDRVCVYCRDCVFDLCAEQGSEVLRCENYAVYARACQDQGVTLGLWRQELNCGMAKKKIIIIIYTMQTLSSL